MASQGQAITSSETKKDPPEEDPDHALAQRVLASLSQDESSLLEKVSSEPLYPSIKHAATDDENDYEFAMRQSFNMNLGDSHPSGMLSKIERPTNLLKAKTSTQLLSLISDEVLDDKDKIANFISQLKAGEVQTKISTEFRQRRLTYSQQTDIDGNATTTTVAESNVASNSNISMMNGTAGVTVGSASTNNISALKKIKEEKESASTPTKAPPVASAPSSSVLTRKQSVAGATVAPVALKNRTSIFASSEIGVVQEKKPPFPIEYLGTYSCHGIEPSPNEEDGIHEKINQDRGCIVYPYHSNRNEALFMVLDGHGEHGDKVSEFVMRQVRCLDLYLRPLLSQC